MRIIASHSSVEEKTGTTSVYDCIKKRIIEHDLPMGKLIHVKTLADELNFSITPVREVLIQLSSENLIREETNRGFFTKNISEMEIKNLYTLNYSLLNLSLHLVQASNRGQGVLNPKIFFAEKDYSSISSSGSFVHIIQNLFVHIALHSGNEEVLHMVRNINDRTYYIRVQECEISEDWKDDLFLLCQIYYRKNIEELQYALQVYHAKLTSQLPGLFYMLKRKHSTVPS